MTPTPAHLEYHRVTKVINTAHRRHQRDVDHAWSSFHVCIFAVPAELYWAVEAAAGGSPFWCLGAVSLLVLTVCGFATACQRATFSRQLDGMTRQAGYPVLWELHKQIKAGRGG